MFCRNCGEKIEYGKKFCKHCGTPVQQENFYRRSVAWIKQNKGVFIAIGALGIIFVLLAVFATGGSNPSSTASSVSEYTTPLPTVPSQIPSNQSSNSSNTSAADTAFTNSNQNSSDASSGSTNNIPTNITSISSADVAPYLTAIGEVVCSANGTIQDSGSGSIWQFANNLQTYVLTNYHVIKGNDSCELVVSPTPTDSVSGIYDLDISSPLEWNDTTDAAAVPITGIDSSDSSSAPIANLNYSIASLAQCPTDLPQESPVVVIGYPASTENNETVTNGVISGYDASNPDKYNDYYISAQADSGNSGGIALSKDSNNDLCLLGVPTWVSSGTYVNEGVVQDINNIFYVGSSQSSR